MNGCEKYGSALIAQLEGSLPAAVAAELALHLEACGGCRAEMAALLATADALEALGDIAQAQVPVVDVLSGVLAGVSAVREGRRTLDATLEGNEDIIAYLDGDLDDFGVARLERERAKNAVLHEELNALAALGMELESLGDALAAQVPTVDLSAAVLARAKDSAVEPAALPSEVEGLPEGIRLAVERFIEGESSSDQTAELYAYAAASPPLAALLDGYAHLHEELDAIAQDEARNVPRIDIVADVVAAARRQARVNNVTPLRTAAQGAQAQTKTSRRAWWATAITAAAACLLLGLYVGRMLPGQQGELNGQYASDHKTGDPERIIPVNPNLAATQDAKTMAEGEMDAGAGKQAAGSSGADSTENATDPATATAADALADPNAEVKIPGKGGRTLKDVLDERQKAFDNDQEALAKLMRWSTLSENEARALMADKNTSPAALLGAAEFLPPNEAANLLKAAVDKTPDDPYLRKALAKAYTDNGQPDLARQQLDAWSKMDPENSMPRYLAAQLAFHDGDRAAGLSMLEEAANYQHGSTYSVQAANYRQSALGATGYNGDVASFLAGSTAGTGDYQYVTRLANDLLDQGNQLRDAGQYSDAQKVYLGIYNLGSQISNSAQLANDYASAYDVQNSALQALVTLSRLFAGVDANTLNQLLSDLQGNMDALSQLMNYFNSVFSGADMSQIMQMIAATLTGGQLNFLQQ